MLNKSKYDFELIVIGSGAGGSTAALTSAKSGYKTALIESDVFGGSAPNHSDVPMSALLQASHLYDQARRGVRFGISSSGLRYNFPTIMGFKDAASKKTGAKDNRQLYEKAGVKTFHGTAHFLSPHEISIGNKRLTARKFLIATGATPTLTDIRGLDTVSHLTPRSVTELHRPVKSIFIVGGGTAGVEIAQLFASLGTKVLIADIASRLLPRDDEEVGQLIGQVFDKTYGIKVLTSTRVVTVSKDGSYKKVTYLRGGEEKTIRVDEILIATGSTPATDLGLENAKVDYDKTGITVSSSLQTSAKHIYAAGDVVGEGPSSTTKAVLESQVAGHNLFHKNKQNVDYTVIPKIIRTHPVVATVGLMEDDAIKSDLKYLKALVPLKNTPRSITADFTDGFVKLITAKNGQILGATIVAPEADTMIHELSLAIRYQLTTYDLATLPHAFLSWNEIIRLAAQKIK
ncbi:NAD(P)/FAD-dependent oxidoreductase [Candidatus Saccharibacteria bacterium]|nr:NAD(P)/FAD-dependent oxidoreductase [Candidatus Saccharibacteria bacterium]